MFSGLFLTTPVFANIIFDPLSPQDANTIPYIILSGGLANSITCIYPNGGDAYSQVANNNNPQYLYIGSYGFTNGVDYKFVEWDTQTLPQLGCADNYTLALLSPQYISTYSYIFQIPQQNQTFYFLDRNQALQINNNLSDTISPSVSLLWPIMLIVVGIPLTFYVLNEIIKLFKFREKKEKKNKMVVSGGNYSNKGDIDYKKEI